MKLYAVDADLQRRLISFASRLRLTSIASKFEGYSKAGLIVLSDGSPEDYVVAIIAQHLNGSLRAALVVKPQRTREASVDFIPRYTSLLAGSAEPLTMVFILDQETWPLKEVFEAFHSRLKQLVDVEELVVKGRVAEFRGLRGGRSILVKLVVSGDDDAPYVKHTVKDYLFKAASILGLGDEATDALKRAEGDPKKAWKLFGRDRQAKVYLELARRREAVEEALRAHMEALSELL